MLFRQGYTESSTVFWWCFFVFCFFFDMRSCFPHVSMNHTHCGNFRDQNLSLWLCALKFVLWCHRVCVNICDCWSWFPLTHEIQKLRVLSLLWSNKKDTLPHNCNNWKSHIVTVAAFAFLWYVFLGFWNFWVETRKLDISATHFPSPIRCHPETRIIPDVCQTKRDFSKKDV